MTDEKGTRFGSSATLAVRPSRSSPLVERSGCENRTGCRHSGSLPPVASRAVTARVRFPPETFRSSPSFVAGKSGCENRTRVSASTRLKDNHYPNPDAPCSWQTGIARSSSNTLRLRVPPGRSIGPADRTPVPLAGVTRPARLRAVPGGGGCRNRCRVPSASRRSDTRSCRSRRPRGPCVRTSPRR